MNGWLIGKKQQVVDEDSKSSSTEMTLLVRDCWGVRHISETSIKRGPGLTRWTVSKKLHTGIGENFITYNVEKFQNSGGNEIIYTRSMHKWC